MPKWFSLESLGFASWSRLKRQVERDSQGRLSMHAAVKVEGLTEVQHAYGQDPNSVRALNDAGVPPLYTAALYRNTEAVEFLLQHGAERDIFACSYLGWTAEAQRLLEADNSLAQARTRDGMTALHYAARSDHLEVAKLLVKFEADVNATDHDGGTALIEACHAGPWKEQPAHGIINLLLEQGAAVNLHAAAAMGRVDLIESLLDQEPASIDDLDENTQTAVFLAARNHHLGVVKLLADRGANLNLSDAVGTAALHRTSHECSDELIRFLIERGANAHLCCYVACGDLEGTKNALSQRPESANETFYEFNAVGYAIHSWQLETLRVLLKHGCTLTQTDQRHILRINQGDQELLDEFLAMGPEAL